MPRIRPHALLAALLLLPLLAVTGPAEAQSTTSPVATTLSEVSAHRFPDGSAANLGYKVSTEVLEPVEPGYLPTVRVDAAEHPDAFSGHWADQGLHAAWVSPRTETQFFPEIQTVESAYFDTYVEDDGAPLNAGDRFDIAAKHLSYDTPLNWGRERGEADGELTWDVATKVHRVAGTYGPNSSEMEVMFVRADLVARGGDFDARDASEELPPLVIDLPRAYGPEVTVGAVTAQFAPYLHYIRNLEGQILGQAGTAVFTADTRGYIPEAREHTLPNGNTIREWHIPLDIIITAIGRTGEAGARSSTSLPTDGLVKTFGDLGSTVTRAPAGSTVITGADIAPQVKPAGARALPAETNPTETQPAETQPTQTQPSTQGDPAEDPSADAARSAPEGSGATLLDEVLDLAAIDHTLAEATTVRMAKRTYDLTVDPDLHGSGALGIGIDHVRAAQELFAAAAATSVTVDGREIPLDRSRLAELRVAPHLDYIRIRFTARSDGDALLDPMSYSRAREGWIHDPGLNLEAVYDLGDDIYAFLTLQSFAEEGGIHSYLRIRSLDGTAHALNATHYLETAEGGPFTYNDAPLTTETSGPTSPITADGITLSGSASGGGIMTIKRAGEIVDAPVADPSVALGDDPIGIYISSANGVVSDFYLSRAGSWLDDVTPGPRFELPPIGEPCTEPPVIDDAEDDADPMLDVRRAWFDYDGASVAATIEVADLPADALSPATYRAGWRLDHIGYGLQAVRDATGAWTFDLGLHPSAGTNWGRIATATGEVDYGSPGYIRILAPAESTLGPRWLDGDILRDTGAVSYGATTPVVAGNSVADRAPAGAPELAYGHGAPWKIAPCLPPLSLELLDAPYLVQHSDAFTARVQVSSGEDVVTDQPVTFTFGGEQKEVTSDGDGVARATFDAHDAPGDYPLSVTTGEGPELISDDTLVTIGKEDSALTLEVSGRGSNRTLRATLADADTRSNRIGSRMLNFYADDKHIGAARTDDAGVATLAPPLRYRGGNHTFGAIFAGDNLFRPSTDSSSAAPRNRAGR